MAGFIAIATLGLQTPAWSQVGTCRPTSPRADEILSYLVYLATSTDSSAIHDRQAFGLSMTSTRKVKLLSKAATCTDAATAVNTAVDAPGTPRAVWVYSYDRLYVVVDPDVSSDDGTATFIFDPHWNQTIGFGFYHFP